MRLKTLTLFCFTVIVYRRVAAINKTTPKWGPGDCPFGNAEFEEGEKVGQDLGHFYTMGERLPGDRLIFEYLARKHADPNGVVSEDVQYGEANTEKDQNGKMSKRRRGKVKEKDRLSCIVVRDYEEGDKPELISGGVGKHEAVVRLKSKPSHGYRFLVNMYSTSY